MAAMCWQCVGEYVSDVSRRFMLTMEGCGGRERLLKSVIKSCIPYSEKPFNGVGLAVKYF